MDYKAKYEQWCQDPIFDKETKAELSAIAGDEKEIEDRFYKDLSFGTGGLRGVIGAGTNRMNVYTVTKATQGLANYIKKQGGEDKGRRDDNAVEIYLESEDREAVGGIDAPVPQHGEADLSSPKHGRA